MGFKKFLIITLAILIPTLSLSSDYKFEVFKENYKEKLISGGGEVKLYHTLQVKTIFGNKLLVLIGKDYEYRKWLRNYFRKHELYIIKIPAAGEEKFKNDLAILVDVQQIHPIWDEKWSCEGCRHDIVE